MISAMKGLSNAVLKSLDYKDMREYQTSRVNGMKSLFDYVVTFFHNIIHSKKII